MAAQPVTAPRGSLWGRDKAGAWHVVRTARVDGKGAHAICGAWHSTRPRAAGRWAELTEWLPQAPAPRLCPRCRAGAPDAARAIRQASAQAPVAEQGRLW
jgi:hypothetical protein